MDIIFSRLTTLAVAGCFTLGVMATNDVKIDHLGSTNSLVRVKGGDKVLILPVQESQDDARVNVLVDGDIKETFFIRLAKTKTDFTVPFDLSPYSGKDVILDVVIPQGRNSVRDAKNDVCWAGIKTADSFDTTNRELKYRPAYHHTPLYGWMNDPNGMFYKDGVWHLYYQYNPYGSKWQNMTWGHSTSTDLVNWKHEPLAIKPNGLGSVFSGSSVVDHANTAGFGTDAIVALYTSAGTSQMQSLAYSKDGGMTFTNYPGNPIVTLESEARDPNMFWNPEIGKWNMVLAHALDHEMLIFSSPDLKNWTLESHFGKGLGAQDGVWECPDLMQLDVVGSDDKKWVLICNINPDGPFGGSGIQYFTGNFDGKTFTPDTDNDGKVPTKWLDYGKDNYALVSFSGAPENRKTVVGWMSNWEYAGDVPTTQFRSANTLPRELVAFKTDYGEYRVASIPSPELASLRGNVVASSGRRSISKSARSFNLPEANGGLCEIVLSFDAGKAETVDFTISNKTGDKVVLSYNTQESTLSMDRRESGMVDFSESFPVVTTTPTFENDGKIELRVFIDRSSMEVFGNNGRFVMTNLVFPNSPYTTLSVSAVGGNATLQSLKVYEINN